ncbi:hypothetical protein KCU77_g3, partial [Aureobasidium melanogenum]
LNVLGWRRQGFSAQKRSVPGTAAPERKSLSDVEDKSMCCERAPGYMVQLDVVCCRASADNVSCMRQTNPATLGIEAQLLRFVLASRPSSCSRHFELWHSSTSMLLGNIIVKEVKRHSEGCWSVESMELTVDAEHSHNQPTLIYFFMHEEPSPSSTPFEEQTRLGWSHNFCTWCDNLEIFHDSRYVTRTCVMTRQQHNQDWPGISIPASMAESSGHSSSLVLTVPPASGRPSVLATRRVNRVNSSIDGRHLCTFEVVLKNANWQGWRERLVEERNCLVKDMLLLYAGNACVRHQIDVLELNGQVWNDVWQGFGTAKLSREKPCLARAISSLDSPKRLGQEA